MACKYWNSGSLFNLRNERVAFFSFKEKMEAEAKLAQLRKEGLSMGEENVRKVIIGKNQCFVWVALGPGEVLPCPPQLAINPNPGPPLHP